MRKLWLLVIALSINYLAVAQSFYYATFNNSSALPVGWTASDSRVSVVLNSPAVQSCCYSSSPTSQEASAFENVIFQHCVPTATTVSLTVANVISTVGRTNIRVGFGRRATNAWNREMAFEWSDDGTNWNLIDSDVSAGASTSWGSVYYDLPAAADNLPNLRFRLSFLAETTDNCTAPPNFRIDDFTVGADFSLPVELIHFNARRSGKEVQLDWATAAEINNDYFAVEHSIDGKTFRTIGQIPGAGTSQSTNQYTFLHREPAPGINYYRLRQVDLDGSKNYSILRTIVFEDRPTYHLFPSPVEQDLNVTWQQETENDLHWAIYNGWGGLVSSGRSLAPATSLSIPVDNLASGKYVLQILREQQFSTLPFLKL
ncbi:MAG: hypothetical protein IPM36_22860 [Lewinellaceae bacterium]|nr:hypothetical protein [Lewinellaceae bacterium]